MSPRSKEQFAELRAESKQRIVTAAFHLFAEEGYHNTSVSKIGLKAEVSKGLLYNYFESKEDLLRGIMADLMQDIIEVFDFESIEKMDMKIMMDLVDMSYDIVKKDIPRWKLYVALSAQPEVTPIFQEAMMTPFQNFMNKMVAFFEAYSLPDPQFAVRQLMAMIDGIQLHIMLDPDNFPIEQSRADTKKHINQLLK